MVLLYLLDDLTQDAPARSIVCSRDISLCLEADIPLSVVAKSGLETQVRVEGYSEIDSDVGDGPALSCDPDRIRNGVFDSVQNIIRIVRMDSNAIVARHSFIGSASELLLEVHRREAVNISAFDQPLANSPPLMQHLEYLRRYELDLRSDPMFYNEATLYDNLYSDDVTFAARGLGLREGLVIPTFLVYDDNEWPATVELIQRHSATAFSSSVAWIGGPEHLQPGMQLKWWSLTPETSKVFGTVE